MDRKFGDLELLQDDVDQALIEEAADLPKRR
jgi:hypothetical protein